MMKQDSVVNIRKDAEGALSFAIEGDIAEVVRKAKTRLANIC